MFSTCLICHRNLGANDVLETFPVGRRVAFDERTGRLWVVCKSCGHWNLSPLEERWEAIELCERFFRESRIKASTDNIGLTTLREGLDLIRIGKPLRPELSAWRYGPRIVARRKRGMLIAAGSVAASAAAVTVAIGASLGFAAIAMYGSGTVGVINVGIAVADKIHEYRYYERDAVTVTGKNGHRYYLKQKHLRFISLESDPDSIPGWQLAMPHEAGILNLTGIQAALTTGQVLAHLNAKGASKKIVNEAAISISDAGDAQQFIRNAIRTRDKRRQSGMLVGESNFDSFGLHYEERLAVEMAMHEDSERQALEGELGALENAWRDAEEIGAISDRMFDKK